MLTSVFVNNTFILLFIEFLKVSSLDFVHREIGFSFCPAWLCPPLPRPHMCVCAGTCTLLDLLSSFLHPTNIVILL